MAIVFDRDFARVWLDGQNPCVFCSVVRAPNKQEMDELAGLQVKLIKELKHTFDDVYSILDLRLCPPISAPVARNYVTKIVPLQFRAGLKHKAFIMPLEKKSLKVLIHAFVTIADLSVSMYSSFDDAMNAINRQHIRSTNKKTRSFFYLLLLKLKHLMRVVPVTL